MFPRDGSIFNCNNWVRIGLAFPRDRYHLELVLENCTRDNCLPGVQKNRRRAEEARQSPLFELRSLRTSFELHSYPFGIRFHEYDSNWDLIREQTHLESINSSKYNRSKQSYGNARPIRTQNVTVPIETGPVDTQSKGKTRNFQ